MNEMKNRPRYIGRNAPMLLRERDHALGLPRDGNGKFFERPGTNRLSNHDE